MRASPSALRLFLIIVIFGFMAGGCVNPLTPEQQSDWWWKQYNPEYRLPYPPDSGGWR
jgi:hypothetical protein